ncbi:MAG: MATE family efflux transporter [Ruminococcaceae bacterium]|nr:MATE family efflux transporter [Oscillospiraceae bacterium]
MQTRAKKKIDIVNGPMIPNIIRYTLPLIASAVVQKLYHTADNIIVGRYNGHVALAAVGSNTSLIHLILNLVMGLSIGANVLVAHSYGAKDEESIRQSVHTSVFVSMLGGLLVGMLGFFLAEPLLRLMDPPADVFPLALIYMKIYFLGAPASMVYNFCASILRAVGDTQKPMFFLTVSGIVNVLLNLIFVLVFEMGVAGVALATIISQYISMVMVLVYLTHLKDCCRLELKKLKIHKDKFLKILHVGIPSGIQSSVFSLSNVFLQGAVNSFDNSALMAGNSAAGQIDAFVHLVATNLSRAAMTFTAQNYGAKKIKNIHKVVINCILLTIAATLVLGSLCMLFARPLLGIFIDDNPEAVSYGIERMQIVVTTYALNGIMSILASSQRGMGSSVIPAIVTLVGACGLRILWIYTVFAAAPSLFMLFLCYPVTWSVTAAVHFLFYMRHHKKIERQYAVSLAE